MPTTLAHATTSHFSCSPLTDARQLANLRSEWKDLLTRSASDEPMLSPQWLLAWWNVFSELGGRRLRALAFHDGSRLAGLALLTGRRHWHRKVIPFRRLELLGSGEPEADSICSDYLNVLAERGSEAEIAAAFARAAARGVAGPWDELVLPMMDGDNAMPALLADVFRALGFAVDLTVTGEAPFIELPATWDDYLRGLTKKHRYSVVRSLRDFEAWSCGQSEIVRAKTVADLERGKQILIELHRQRWQADGEGGTFRSSRFLAFHDSVMPALLREGALDLSWLNVRGEPVAAMYNIVWNNKVFFYQCGRKLDVPDAIRPGSVLLAHAIRAAIEAGRRKFDFLNGVTLYKSQLATGQRQLMQLRVVRPCLAEAIRRAAEGCIARTRAARHFFLRQR
jgi:CelD/BcsL family acetyltransferase involved in cellulose biosynthesis